MNLTRSVGHAAAPADTCPRGDYLQMAGRARTEDRSGPAAPLRGVTWMERIAYSKAGLMGSGEDALGRAPCR